MGCTPEEQATYDAFFGPINFDGLISYDCNGKPRPASGGPIFQADMVDRAIIYDAPKVDGVISVGGRGAGKTCAAHEETLQRYAKQTTGVIGRIDLSTHEEYTSLKVKEGMYKEVAKGYKPIELEDIMHIRGSVPHFMGHAVPSWEDVDRIEKECRNLSNSLNIQFHAACSIAAGMFAKAVPDQYSPNKIKVVLKELANQAQFAKEKTIFNCRISARQARRSAQGVKFTKQLKNNFNVKKGK